VKLAIAGCTSVAVVITGEVALTMLPVPESGIMLSVPGVAAPSLTRAPGASADGTFHRKAVSMDCGAIHEKLLAACPAPGSLPAGRSIAPAHMLHAVFVVSTPGIEIFPLLSMVAAATAVSRFEPPPPVTSAEAIRVPPVLVTVPPPAPPPLDP
jgi:hypothetical protein